MLGAIFGAVTGFAVRVWANNLGKQHILARKYFAKKYFNLFFTDNHCIFLY